MVTTALVVSLVVAWLLGIWLGYKVARDKTMGEAMNIVMKSHNETVEREWTASEKLAMINVRSFILSKMEAKWLRH